MARTKSAEVWKSWCDRLQRFQDTDLTVAAFCDREGVSQAAFYVWRKKLPSQSAEQPRKSAEKAAVTLAPRSAFVQILPGASRTHGTEANVVMTLTDGTRVDFPASDRELIAHVVLSVAKAHSTTAHAATMLQGGHR